MRQAWDVATIRAAEGRLMGDLPEGTLMQRAASGLASVCAQLLNGSGGQVYGSRIVVLVGRGDNGGDALFAGARLAGRGARVDAVLVSDQAHEGGLAALHRAGGWVHPLEERDSPLGLIASADLVVDGIVGIGGTGSLREPAATYARVADESDALVVSVDLPSGVDADTGEVAGEAITADVTVTFGALKPGLLVTPGHEHVGVLTVVDIGLNEVLSTGAADGPALTILDAADVASLLPHATPGDHKYSRGVVGIVAGSTQMPGAAMLCTAGARVAGIGMVRLYDRNAVVSADVVAKYPDIVLDSTDPVESSRVNAWIGGPGLGRGQAERALVRRLLDVETPLVLDADALFHLGTGVPGSGELRDALRSRAVRGLVTVTTPHEGEFARLVGAAGTDRVESVRAAAGELGVIMLLKGSTTIIATPEGDAYVNTVAVPELATAGSGDVLSGLIGGLLASGQGRAPGVLATAAAYLHGLAGSRLAEGGRAFTAENLSDAIADAMADLTVAAR